MKFMIDGGHGGSDPGAVGNDLQEKDLTLALALRIGELLISRGAEVHFTRATDVFVDLSERARMANEAGVDYFLSIHINAGGGTGFESFTYLGDTNTHDDMIHNYVATVFTVEGLPDRGRKYSNLAVLRETNMPAVLLEYGFIDSPKDAALLKDDKFIERLAVATAEGVAVAFGLSREGEDRMLREEVEALKKQVAELKERASMPVPDWAREAVEAAVTSGLIDTPDGGSYDFYRVLTVLHRKGGI